MNSHWITCSWAFRGVELLDLIGRYKIRRHPHLRPARLTRAISPGARKILNKSTGSQQLVLNDIVKFLQKLKYED